MAAKYFVLFAACLALGSGARLRRDSPILQDLEKHAKEFQKTLSEQYNSMVNSKDSEHFNKALKEGSESILNQLSTFSNTLQGALKDADGKVKEALQQTQQKLQQTSDELKKKHPEVEQQATALREKIQTALQSTVAEAQTLAKQVAANVDETNQKLAPKIKEAYDDFVKQAAEVQKKLHEAATKQ